MLYSTVQHSTVQYSTVECCTALHSTVINMLSVLSLVVYSIFFSSFIIMYNRRNGRKTRSYMTSVSADCNDIYAKRHIVIFAFRTLLCYRLIKVYFLKHLLIYLHLHLFSNMFLLSLRVISSSSLRDYVFMVKYSVFYIIKKNEAAFRVFSNY